MLSSNGRQPPCAPELRGSLEAPLPAHSGRTLAVSGWVFSCASPIRSLDLAIDGSAPIAMLVGLPRPDVALKYQQPGAAESGFHFQIPVEERWSGRDLALVIVPTLEDGHQVSCFTQTVHVASSDGETALAMRDILRAAIVKAWTALRRRRLPLSPASWITALRLHWREASVVGEDDGRPGTFHRASLDRLYRTWLKTRAGTGSVSEPSPAPASSKTLSVVALVSDPRRIEAVVRSFASEILEGCTLCLAGVTQEAFESASSAQSACTGASALTTVSAMAVPRNGEPWLPPGDSEHVVLIDTESILAPDSLAHVARFLPACDAAWIYTDDDRLDSNGARCDPYLKGAFSRELCAVDDYASRLAIVRRDAIEAAGGLRNEYADAQIYELLLRVVARGGAVQHLPEVCCHQRVPVPAVLSATHRLAAERVLFDGAAAMRVELAAPAAAFEVQRVCWSEARVANLSVTIVIPTRDRVDLLRPCIDSLCRTTDPARTSLLIIDDHSEQEPSLGTCVCSNATSACGVASSGRPREARDSATRD